MASPLFYKPAPRWQAWACFAGAVVIECAALAVASLRPQSKIPTTSGLTAPAPPLEVVLTPTPPDPPVPHSQPPPMPLPPAELPAEFMTEQPAPPEPVFTPPKPSHRMSERPPARPAQFSAVRTSLTIAPPPPYPYEARRAHVRGAGKFLLHFDADGSVTEVEVAQSTGSVVLDQASRNTFRRWRCRPGAPREVYVPISFTLQGAQL